MLRSVTPLLLSITHVCFVFANYNGKCHFTNGNEHEALKILEKLEGKKYASNPDVVCQHHESCNLFVHESELRII